MERLHLGEHVHEADRLPVGGPRRRNSATVGDVYERRQFFDSGGGNRLRLGVVRDEVPADRVEAIGTTLHHNHLPKLADAGLVAYDAEAKTVSPAGVEELSSFVDVSDGS